MINVITRGKRFLALMGLGLGLVSLMACSQAPLASTRPGTPDNNSGSPAPAVGAPAAQPGLSGGVSGERGNVGFASTLVSHDGRITGISVSGQGQVSGAPDLATVTLGVEALRDTVQAARDDAAAAMNQIITLLKDRGIADRDIQTGFFQIHPRYDREGQNITGFQVTNQVNVKIRDLSAVSGIIDEVVALSGNLTRFQGISFSIENTKPLEEQARAAAVEDLTAKANQLATLTGVELGNLISITETGGLTPFREVVAAERAIFDQASAAPTPILPGEVDVMVTLQAVFAIEQQPQ
jgi:uncharacterized protein YggE